jgi:LemA protein
MSLGLSTIETVLIGAVGVGLLLFVVAALFVIGVYNRLVALRNRFKNAFSQIDVQLKRRHDLIPNLVETVKGYAAHERSTFDAVTRARTAALGVHGPADRAEAEAALGGTLKTLFAVSEAYPELKANTNFLALQQELSTTEDKAAYARQYYNDAVLGLNTKVATFPTVLVAGPLGFRAREFFRAPEGQTAPISVRF